MIDRYQSIARIAVVIGALASMTLMLYAGRNNPHTAITILFVFWVLAPFVAFAVATKMSSRWPMIPRATLYSAIVISAVGAPAIYLLTILRPRATTAAFPFVATPIGIWLLLLIAVPIAAFVARARTPRPPG